MNKIIYRTISIMAIFALTAGGYLNVGAASALPAFPGAVGFGSLTVGGRGGTVLQVTNLNDSGAGSLREAVAKTGPRIVIFKVSGTIQLTQHIKVDNPYLTILGQTSPGGIQLTGAGIKVRTHDVVVRGLMIRPGNGATGAPLGDRTGFIIHNDRDSSQPYNIVFDHNSVEWSTDETASTWLPVYDITFSNNIMAEGLNCAGHPDGCHSMGLLIGTGAQRVTLYGNLFANNDWRNPIMQDNTSTEVYNNVLYSWKAGSIIIQGTGGGANFTNIVGNFTKATSCSATAGVLIDSADTGSKVYLDDWTNVSGSKTLIDRVKSTTPVFVGSGIQAMSATQAHQYVLLNSGARNDSVDTRVKDNVRNGTLPNGKCLIDSPNEVGGWPTLTGAVPTDTDNDGLPNSFESAYGLDLQSTAYAPSGYTWIEEYANGFYTSAVPASPSITPSVVPTLTSVPTQPPTFTFTPSAVPTQPATFTAIPPSGGFVSTELNPTSLTVGGIALSGVRLNNVPVEGYKSAEFTCTYNANLVAISNIVPANLFGADAAVAIYDPQNGSFIFAVAGTNGNKATTSGPVFTFNAKGLQAGQSAIQCTVRVSKGDNVPIDLPFTGASLTILGVELTPTAMPFESPTPTSTLMPVVSPTPTFTFTPLPSPNGSLTGQVIASKPVAISLVDANNAIVMSAVTNPDGTFNLTVLAGNYNVVAVASGFLSHQGSASIIAGGNTTAKPIIRLLAGDIDNNNVIDQFDALTIGMSYNTSMPAAADLNNDSMINFLDLELLAENYRKTGPTVWE